MMSVCYIIVRAGTVTLMVHRRSCQRQRIAPDTGPRPSGFRCHFTNFLTHFFPNCLFILYCLLVTHSKAFCQLLYSFVFSTNFSICHVDEAFCVFFLWYLYDFTPLSPSLSNLFLFSFLYTPFQLSVSEPSFCQSLHSHLCCFRQLGHFLSLFSLFVFFCHISVFVLSKKPMSFGATQSLHWQPFLLNSQVCCGLFPYGSCLLSCMLPFCSSSA